MGEKAALTCLVTFIPLLMASLGFPSFTSTPTAFINHPPPTTISSNLLHPSSSLQRRIPNDAVKPSSIVLPPTSLIPLKDNERILHLLRPTSARSPCIFISLVLLYPSRSFGFHAISSHNARLTIIIRLAPPLQVWAHRTYFFRLVAPKGSKFLIKW